MNSIKLIYKYPYICKFSDYDNDFYTLNKELTRYVDIYASANFTTHKKHKICYLYSMDAQLIQHELFQTK